jgi:hypothetical protein
MERFAVFVDAGYLYAASGTLLFGSPNRRELAVDFDGVVGAITRLAASDCGHEHLRTYWYDGARNAIPTAEQIEVANLPGTKLRLGRLTRQGQKGVDSRIVRDLIILAMERAISTAYLLGGDEDLREGVSEAQERGVRVVLIGVEPPTEQNLSPTLAMEADDVLTLDAEFLRPHIREREADVVAAAEPADPRDPTELGRAFAATWTERLTQEQLVELLNAQPRRIPAEVDRLLLAYAVRSMQIARVSDEDRRRLREGFWRGLEARIPQA